MSINLDFLHSFVESMPGAMLCVTASGDVLHCNDRAVSLAGVDRDVAKGKTVCALFPGLEEKWNNTSPDAPLLFSMRVMDRCYILRLLFSPYREAATWVFAWMTSLTLYDKEKQAARLARIESAGELAGAMAHKLNNPLAAIIGFAQNAYNRTMKDLKRNQRIARECDLSLEQLRCYLEQRNVSDMLQGINESGKRASCMISTVLQFSTNTHPKLFPGQHLAALAEQALEKNLQDVAEPQSLEIVRDFKETTPIACDPAGMLRAIQAVIQNSLDALESFNDNSNNPQLHLRSYEEQQTVILEIEDNGPGMDEAIRSRACDPFFSTKGAKGSGLGLSCAYYSVVGHHNGQLDIESSPDSGTLVDSHCQSPETFRLFLL